MDHRSPLPRGRRRAAPQTFAEHVLDTQTQRPIGTCGVALARATPDVLDVFCRLVRLLDAPQDIAALAALIEQELLYRVLQGPAGGPLRQAALESGPMARLGPVIRWIRAHPAEPVRIDALADMANMSASSLHRHFKAGTAVTPLQYQKQLRLQEARRLLSVDDTSATAVATAVGYQSASQFSREYRRAFGEAPKGAPRRSE